MRNSDHFNSVEEKFFIQVDPVIDVGMRKCCLLPYPNHVKGCPNWGKRDICPPKAPLLSESLDLTAPVYAIYNIFDFKGHVEKIRDKHPQWTERQLKCCLYWQPKARKQLKEKIRKFMEIFRDLTIIINPEAQGVNLTATMKKVGIILEWPPENVTYQIVLAGEKIGKRHLD